MSANIGKVVGVNGNLLKVEFENPVILNEVAYARLSGTELRLKAEVIRIRGNIAELQVFEDTTGLKIADDVEFTGDLLSVELGPGLDEGRGAVVGRWWVPFTMKYYFVWQIDFPAARQTEKFEGSKEFNVVKPCLRNLSAPADLR